VRHGAHGLEALALRERQVGNGRCRVDLRDAVGGKQICSLALEPVRHQASGADRRSRQEKVQRR
jgi:hypothetical protein